MSCDRTVGPPINFKPGDKVRHKTDINRTMVVLWVTQPSPPTWLDGSLEERMGRVGCRYPRTRGMLEQLKPLDTPRPDFVEQSFYPYELETVS